MFFSALPKAKISFLSNFEELCLYFLVCGTSSCGNRLSLEFMKEITSEKTLVFKCQKNMK